MFIASCGQHNSHVALGPSQNVKVSSEGSSDLRVKSVLPHGSRHMHHFQLPTHQSWSVALADDEDRHTYDTTGCTLRLTMPYHAL